jgi:hypothetical protein
VSEDTTKDMSKKYDTKPTIETVLERINQMHVEMQERFKEMRIEMDVRFDRVESIASGTRAEFLTLRADFRELKQALVENIPALKA